MHTTAVLYSKVTVFGLSLAMLALMGLGLGAPIRKARDTSTISDSTIADLLSGFDVVKTYANNTDISPKLVADMGFRGPLCDLLAYRDLIATAVASDISDSSSSTLNSKITKLLTLLNRTAEDACLMYLNITSDVTAESPSTCSLGSQEMTMFRVSCMSTRLHSTVNFADKSTAEWCQNAPGEHPCNRYPCTWARSVFPNMEMYNAVEKILTQHRRYYCFFEGK